MIRNCAGMPQSKALWLWPLVNSTGAFKAFVNWNELKAELAERGLMVNKRPWVMNSQGLGTVGKTVSVLNGKRP